MEGGMQALSMPPWTRQQQEAGVLAAYRIPHFLADTLQFTLSSPAVFFHIPRQIPHSPAILQETIRLKIGNVMRQIAL